MNTTTTERVITWNVGSKPDKLLMAALLVLYRLYVPAAFVLQEVADRTKVLQAFADRAGYTLTRLDQGQHSSSVAVLTRGDLPAGKSGGFLMTARRWVGRSVAGSKGSGKTKPKWTTWVRLDFWDLGWIVASTHLTPSHHVALVRVLVRIQVAALALWMRTRRRIVLLGGDFNETVGSRFGLLAPLKAVADVFTAPSHESRAIDQWWVTKDRLARAGITVTVEALDAGPSDHNPMMLTLTRVVAHECPVCGFSHLAA